jgi:hypothetical protein
MEDYMDEVLQSDEFGNIIRQIEHLAARHEQELLDACKSQSVESIRFAAGRVSGIRLVASMLTKAQRNGKG